MPALPHPPRPTPHHGPPPPPRPPVPPPPTSGPELSSSRRVTSPDAGPPPPPSPHAPPPAPDSGDYISRRHTRGHSPAYPHLRGSAGLTPASLTPALSSHSSDGSRASALSRPT